MNEYIATILILAALAYCLALAAHNLRKFQVLRLQQRILMVQHQVIAEATRQACLMALHVNPLNAEAAIKALDLDAIVKATTL